MVTWLAGFRWVEWNGTLDVRSSSMLGEDLVSVGTGNDLYGGQLGADVLLWQGWRGLQVNALGKAGVFYNTAYQNTSANVSTQPPYAGTARSAADQTAFFGELGINGAWWITDCLACRLRPRASTPMAACFCRESRRASRPAGSSRPEPGGRGAAEAQAEYAR
jgi:hypothetical protein